MGNVSDVKTQIVVEHPYQTGLNASVDSIDEMARLLEHVKEQQARLKACEYELRESLGKLTTSEKKTRHLKGESIEVKLTYPSPSWSQPVLKELVKEDPDMSALYIRVSSYAPNLKEVNKLETTSGTERFEKYKAKILSARSESNQPPSVSIKKKDES